MVFLLIRDNLKTGMVSPEFNRVRSFIFLFKGFTTVIQNFSIYSKGISLVSTVFTYLVSLFTQTKVWDVLL